MSATMISSVRMRAVKEMATTCTNSHSNSSRAPRSRALPKGGGCWVLWPRAGCRAV